MSEPTEVSEAVDTMLQRPPSILARGLVYIIFAVVVTGLVWSSVFSLNVVITGKGALAPYGLHKKVEAEAPGVVKEVLVKEGQRVEAGEVLFRQDDYKTMMAIEKLKKQMRGEAESIRFAETSIASAELELTRSRKEYD
ncbi:MAG: biotin/lipoyl-binding protein, partial [Elusimicrobia bacterium]|nr:biotin/lipoyl-binding protein [Elusimicrobiota bacterium]